MAFSVRFEFYHSVSGSNFVILCPVRIEIIQSFFVIFCVRIVSFSVRIVSFMVRNVLFCVRVASFNVRVASFNVRVASFSVRFELRHLMSGSNFAI